jgi:hypothetical protein
VLGRLDGFPRDGAERDVLKSHEGRRVGLMSGRAVDTPELRRCGRRFDTVAVSTNCRHTSVG